MVNEICEFFAGTSVFITGATGFFGKVLTQKLLRSVENINIYLLIREKRNESSEVRLRKLLENSLFDTMKRRVTNYQSKIHLVKGDLSEIDLGLSEEDRNRLIDNIDVVFHCGATLNMALPLSVSVKTNVRGPRDILNLCKQMRRIKSIMMVSTGYSNSHLAVVEEKIYSPTIQPELLIRLVEELDESIADNLPVLAGHPNTYCFSKGLSEGLVAADDAALPVGIFRPTVVTSTYADPAPGWTDNVNGMLGVMFAMLMGVLRIGNFDMGNNAEMVPVDMCINALICAAWDVGVRKEKLVYNFSADPAHWVTWGYLARSYRLNYKYAFKNMVYVPIFHCVRNPTLYKILHFFCHLVPAYILDFLLIVLQKKTLFLKNCEKIMRFNAQITYFTKINLNFKRDNVMSLWGKLSKNAREEFNFDYTTIDFDKLCSDSALGFKKYLLNEPITENDASKLRRYKFLHFCIKLFVGVILIFLLTKPFILYVFSKSFTNSSNSL